jgi:probable HAF family extracellular repeat protein
MAQTARTVIATLPAVLFGVTASAAPAAPPAPFQGVGSMPGTSHAYAVSYDGSTVVGRVNATNAFRWTAETGLVDLGEGTPHAVSANGSTVVGEHSVPEFGGARAFRWTAATGKQSLDYYHTWPGPENMATAISGDGLTIGGRDHTYAVTWTVNPATGAVNRPTLVWEDKTRDLNAISHDGSTWVGFANSPERGRAGQAYQYRAGGPVRLLGHLGGAPNPGSEAFAVSADGSVVVGHANLSGASHDLQAFRWTEATGMVGLPGGMTRGRAVSGDGSIVVGSTGYDPPFTSDDALIWDAEHGTRDFQDVLTEVYGLGPQLTGWSLSSANGISGDGRTIVGQGQNPQGRLEGWVVNLPDPGDTNMDGVTDVADLGVLATNFNTPSGANWRDGDMNGDGAVDVTDLGILATNYNGGAQAGSFAEALAAYPLLAAAVPEPTTLGMLAVGSLAMLARRGRRGRRM